MGTRLRFDDHYREHLNLPDGAWVRLRLVRPSDKERLRRGFLALSPGSRQRRFLGGKQSLSDSELDYLTELDQVDHVAIGAVEVDRFGIEREGVGVGRFVRIAAQPDCAEVALAVIDRMHRRGIGRLLLARLVDAARERGIRRLRFECMADNVEIRKLVQGVCGAALVDSDAGTTIAEVALPDRRSDSPRRVAAAFDTLCQLLCAVAVDSIDRQVNRGLRTAHEAIQAAFERRHYWLPAGRKRPYKIPSPTDTAGSRRA